MNRFKGFRNFLMYSLGLLLFFLIPINVSASDFRAPEVKIFNSQNNSEVNSFLSFAKNFIGGSSVVTCDLDNNGYEEIITGAGYDGGPQVRIFNSLGQPKFTPGFFAYEENFRGGVNVACGDLDGDGFGEIVTAPKINGGPHIRIFNRFGEPILTPGFFVYDKSFKGGINIAVGDIDGGGLPEIIVAPASNAAPEIKVYNASGNLIKQNFYPYHENFTGGVSLATANVNGGNDDEVIFGVQSQGTSIVKILNLDKNIILGEWTAFPDTYKSGINVTGGDINNDGFDEIIVAANSGGGPHVKSFDINGNELSVNLFAYESDFRGGVYVTSGDVDNDGLDEIITSPSKKHISGIVDHIVVDLSEQRLYAYENDILLKSFLVSTGLPGTPTRTGEFVTYQKIYSKLYSGVDFYFPNTLWNMRFDGGRLLHGAYWHDNFGQVMSHGCVNIKYENAEWLYNSTPLGVTVTVIN